MAVEATPARKARKTRERDALIRFDIVHLISREAPIQNELSRPANLSRKLEMHEMRARPIDGVIVALECNICWARPMSDVGSSQPARPRVGPPRWLQWVQTV